MSIVDDRTRVVEAELDAALERANREPAIHACFDAVATLAVAVDALRRRVQLLEEEIER